MKKITTALIETIVTIPISVCLLILMYNWGESVDFDSIIYGIVIGGGQMFIPFIAYVILINFLVYNYIQLKFKKKRYILMHFVLSWTFTVLVTSIFSVVDELYSNNHFGMMRYMKEFSLFLMFGFLLPFVQYSIQHMKTTIFSRSKAN